MLDYRHYAAAKHRFESKGKKRDDDPLTDLVKEIAFDLVRDEMNHG